MSFTIGTVNFLVGQASAVSTDGAERGLSVGDQVLNDDVVRVAEGGEIEIILSNGESVSLADGVNWIGVDALSPETVALLQQLEPIAQVDEITGEVIAVSADGSERILQPGDQIFADETIRTTPGSSISLVSSNGGQPVVVEDGQSWLANADSSTPNSPFDTTEESVGTVVITNGTVVAVDAQGNERVLENGDQIFADEVIRTDPGASVQLTTVDESGQPIVLQDGQSWLATSDTYTPSSEFDQTTAVNSDIDALQQAILAGADPTQVGEASAAGGAPAAGGDTASTDGGGSDFVSLDRTGGEVNPDAGYQTGTFTTSVETPQEEQPVQDVTIVISAAFINAENDTVVEGNQAIVRFTLSEASSSPITINTEFGSVLVPAGGLAADLAISTREDEFFLQGDDALALVVTSVTGGSGETFDLSNANALITVIDDDDSTIVSLSTSDVTEDDASVTFTATLTNPAEGAVTVTTDLGDITIADGAATGTLVVETQDSDVYLDADSITATIIAATGGNFEQLDIGTASATAQIVDSVDLTTATLSSAITGDEDGATVTYTVTLTNATDVAETFTFDVDGVERSITVDANSSTGTTTVDYDDVDVFKDAETVGVASNFAASDADGSSNYESLTLTNNATGETLVDSVDLTTATLSSAITGDEDGATVTYTVTLTNPTAVAETFTFDVDGVERTINVAAGGTTGNTTVTYSDPDVFKDAETVGVASNFAATDADGASNYESLTLTNNATGETLVDSVDPTTATLSSAIVGDEDGATVTYTVTLTNPTAVAETFTFDVDGVERTINVAAGGTTGNTTVTYSDPDVFKDAETVGVASNFAATDADGASNYESLTLTNNATGETLVDSVDPTTATLSSAIVGDEDGATVTYTVTLTNPTAVAETFTFDVDGVERTINVAAGGTTGNTTVTYSDPDVFKDAETVGVASNFAATDADGASNYESLTLTNNATGETLVDSVDPTTATLSSAIVGDEDGATVTYTVTLTNPTAVAETFTFDVDGVERTINVAAGGTTGNTTVTYSDPDVFKDAETVGVASNFAATDADGASNYESLTLTNNATGETLVDSVDPTTATLSSAIVGDEDGATVTYTVTLTNPTAVAETFTFDVDGVERTINVAAGGTTGNTTVTYSDPDVFKDAETVGVASNFAATDADGASNYESLTLTNNATGETLVDSVDPTTATLSSAIVGDEDGATVTYTVTLTNPTAVAETFTFDVDGVERTINVAAGGTTGNTTVTYSDPDVFKDAETVGVASNFAATDADGASNYESLTLTNNATGETLVDSVDPTTATLSSAIVGDEDGATVTYTVTLTNPTAVAETFTFDVDGVERTINVAAGGTTGNTTVTYSDPDVFKDAETVGVASNFAATDADGASNYESLTLTNNATGETLVDSVDPTTATLSSAIVGDEDGATVTYTVTLTNPTAVAETFTFDVDGVERTINVAAGGTTGNTTVTYSDPDVFKDAETVGVASNFAATDADGASNYESLTLTNNATGETLVDSVDLTTIQIGNVTVLEGNNAVVDLSITNAPIQETTVALSIVINDTTTLVANATFVAGGDTTSASFNIPVIEHGTPGSATDSELNIDITGVVTTGAEQFEDVSVSSGSITILDDFPVTPLQTEYGLLDKLGSFTGYLDIDNSLTDNAGADSDGLTVRFKDSIEINNPSIYTSNNQPIYFYVSDDGLTLVGTTDSVAPVDWVSISNEVIRVALDVDTASYTVTTVQEIDTTTLVSFADDNSGYDFVGGNAPWAGFVGDVTIDTQDLLLTPAIDDGTEYVNDGTINTTANTGGISGGASVGDGESFRVDFVWNLQGDPQSTGGGDYDTITKRDHLFDGHYVTNGASAMFTATSGTMINFAAFLDDDGDANFDGSVNPDPATLNQEVNTSGEDVVGDGVRVDITAIAIAHNGESQSINTDGTYTIGAIDFVVSWNADGTVNVNNVSDDLGSPMISVFTATGYTTLEYTYVSGDTFKIGDFGAMIESELPLPIDLPGAIELVDGDGDAIDSNLSFALVPDGQGIQYDVDNGTASVTYPHLQGTSGADSLTGDLQGNVLVGGDGDDLIVGNEGDDFIFGNRGSDTLTGDTTDGSGAAGADTFFWLSSDADGGTDTVTDFSASEGDVLDFSDLLDSNSGYELRAEDTTTGGTLLKVVDTNNSDAVVQAVELEGVTYDAALVQSLLNSGNIDDGSV